MQEYPVGVSITVEGSASLLIPAEREDVAIAVANAMIADGRIGPKPELALNMPDEVHCRDVDFGDVEIAVVATPKEEPDQSRANGQPKLDGQESHFTVYFRYRFDDDPRTGYMHDLHYGHVDVAAKDIDEACDKVMKQERASMIGHTGDRGSVEFVYATNDVDPNWGLWCWQYAQEDDPDNETRVPGAAGEKEVAC